MGLKEDLKDFYKKTGGNVCQISGLVTLNSSENQGVLFHKFVLAARSEIFYDKFMKNKSPNDSIEIPEISTTELKALHKYLYTDLISEELVTFKTLSLANKYGFLNLHEKCVQALENRFKSGQNDAVSNTTKENVCHKSNTQKKSDEKLKKPSFDVDKFRKTAMRIPKTRTPKGNLKGPELVYLYECNEPNCTFQRTESRQVFEFHMKTHKISRCEVCDETFHGIWCQKQLNKHMKEIHETS